MEATEKEDEGHSTRSRWKVLKLPGESLMCVCVGKVKELAAASKDNGGAWSVPNGTPPSIPFILPRMQACWGVSPTSEGISIPLFSGAHINHPTDAPSAVLY